jgi:hypothetical protein
MLKTNELREAASNVSVFTDYREGKGDYQFH